MKIRIVCEKCGKEPMRNEALSNKNWTVVDNEPCAYCGGKLHFETILKPKKALK